MEPDSPFPKDQVERWPPPPRPLRPGFPPVQPEDAGLPSDGSPAAAAGRRRLPLDRDGLRPRERRSLGRMDERLQVEKLSWGRSRLKVTAVWGSYTFDSLFRLALGMMLGSFAARVLLFDQELSHIWLAGDWWDILLLMGPPLTLLIALGFRWSKRNRIRPHLFKAGLVLGAAHTTVALAAVLA